MIIQSNSSFLKEWSTIGLFRLPFSGWMLGAPVLIIFLVGVCLRSLVMLDWHSQVFLYSSYVCLYGLLLSFRNYLSILNIVTLRFWHFCFHCISWLPLLITYFVNYMAWSKLDIVVPLVLLFLLRVFLFPDILHMISWLLVLFLLLLAIYT